MSDGVNLIGAGVGVTVIHNSNIVISARFYGKLDKGFRVSGMSLYGSGSDPLYLDSVHDFRVDHMYIECNGGDAIGTIYSNSGLIDHCTIKLNSSYYGVMVNRTPTENYPACWQNLTDILGKSTAIFIEDNVIQGTGYYHGTVGHGSAHYVVRHNTFTDDSGSARVDAHGCGYGPPCGTRLIEVYNNTFNYTGSPGGNNTYGMDVRGGSAVIFNNTWNNFDNGLVMFLDLCNNTPPYPSPMQPHDIWFWNNTFNNLGYGYEAQCPCTDPTTQSHCCQVFLADFAQIPLHSADYIQLNRDYFLRAPSQALDGFTYTPYTYPHLLQGGGDTTPPAAPSGVSVE